MCTFTTLKTEGFLPLRFLASGACNQTGIPWFCSVTDMRRPLHAPQDVVQRIGSKGPLADFARALCARLSPQLIAAPHVAELLRMAGGKGDDALDEAFLAGVLALLVDIADAAPTLFQGAVPQVACPSHARVPPELPARLPSKAALRASLAMQPECHSALAMHQLSLHLPWLKSAAVDPEDLVRVLSCPKTKPTHSGAGAGHAGGGRQAPGRVRRARAGALRACAARAHCGGLAGAGKAAAAGAVP